MSNSCRRCLKCGRKISGKRWLCGACRAENRNISSEAEGVSDLYSEED